MSKTFCTIPFRQIATFNDKNYHHCYASVPTVPDLTDISNFAIKKIDGSNFNIKENSVKEVWNSDWYKKLRLDLINGVQNPACKQCWDREKIGTYSARLKEISGITDIRKEIEYMNADGTMKVGPRYIEIRTGNFCNLKCIMCHPINSSSMAKEIKQWQKMFVEIPKYVNMPSNSIDQIDKFFDKTGVMSGLTDVLEDIEIIQFYGGEPLVTHEVSMFLDDLISLGREKFITIKIITNLTIDNQKILDKLDRFKKVEIIVSWDHVDAEKSHYIRFPQDYDRFLENFDRILATKNYDIKISPTVSIFNIFDIPLIFDHFESLNLKSKNPINITANVLEIPKYFSVTYLSESQKKQIYQLLENYLKKNKSYLIFKEGTSYAFHTLDKLKNIMHLHPSDYDEIVLERTRTLELYDTYRNTNSKQLFPYLYI